VRVRRPKGNGAVEEAGRPVYWRAAIVNCASALTSLEDLGGENNLLDHKLFVTYLSLTYDLVNSHTRRTTGK